MVPFCQAVHPNVKGGLGTGWWERCWWRLVCTKTTCTGTREVANGDVHAECCCGAKSVFGKPVAGAATASSDSAAAAKCSHEHGANGTNGGWPERPSREPFGMRVHRHVTSQCHHPGASKSMRCLRVPAATGATRTTHATDAHCAYRRTEAHAASACRTHTMRMHTHTHREDGMVWYGRYNTYSWLYYGTPN